MANEAQGPEQAEEQEQGGDVVVVRFDLASGKLNINAPPVVVLGVLRAATLLLEAQIAPQRSGIQAAPAGLLVPRMNGR